MKIFFATDIHGSERCYVKFLNAAKFYKVEKLILGGDLTGKLLVPLLEDGHGGYDCSFLGQTWHAESGVETEKLEGKIRAAGQYPSKMTQDEFEELKQNPKKLETIFLDVMQSTLIHWLQIAQERLKGTGVTMYATGGNDDPFTISEIIKKSEFVINPEDGIVDIDGGHEMISLGYSNETPWKCPRDISEEELGTRIERLASGLKNPMTSIFNLHCPPVDSTLDTAIKLDPSFTPPKPIMVSGQPLMFGAGSISVRTAIEKYQPLLSLHGHIHESRGLTMLGRTTCVNPGSEYGEGILRGALIAIDKGKVNVQLTSG